MSACVSFRRRRALPCGVYAHTLLVTYAHLNRTRHIDVGYYNICMCVQDNGTRWEPLPPSPPQQRKKQVISSQRRHLEFCQQTRQVDRARLRLACGCVLKCSRESNHSFPGLEFFLCFTFPVVD